MKKKKLLLSALLAVSIGAMPSVAGEVEVLSDEDLEEVSAQGLQAVRNGNQLFTIANNDHLKGSIQEQNNNLDSVQLRSNAQQNAEIQGLSNAAVSSVNTNANFLDIGDKITDSILGQENVQNANNHNNDSTGFDALAGNVNKQSQYVENGYQGIERGTIVSIVMKQNNNNNSVQMRDDAQEAFSGIMVFNSAASAGNAGFNMGTVTNEIDDSSLTQMNDQVANNSNNLAIADENAVAVNAEVADGTSIIDLQNWTDPEGATVEGRKTQYIKNVYGYNASRPSEYKYTTIEDQNNNNNSVQSKNNVQANAQIIHQSNIAQTSSNYGMNLLDAGSISDTVDPHLYQGNSQIAYNHNNNSNGAIALSSNVNKETQYIENMTYRDNPGSENGKIILQNNNNNSVQYRDNVQKWANITVSTNAALSSLNTGYNMLQTGEIRGSTVAQENDQEARNFENVALGDSYAYAGNIENTGPTQTIENGYATVTEQNNNNNSVQLKDDTQRYMSSMLVSNASKTAANNGLNIIQVSGYISASDVTQQNNQSASNHNNEAYSSGTAKAVNVNKETQKIVNAMDGNFEIVPGGEQNNNNNSVQLSGNAQGGAEIVTLINSSLSAVNTGGNAIFASQIIARNGAPKTVSQLNTQAATNMNNIAEADMAYAQNKDIEMAGGYTQKIENYVANLEGNQNNNNNSVQITGNAQEGVKSFVSANAAGSASNFGVNLIATNQEITGITEGDPALRNMTINQVNDQTAQNHLNEATGVSFAEAKNISKESQYVENEEGLYIANGVSQLNNNNSVQLGDNAQQYAQIAMAQNSAVSALNAGLNLMSIGDEILRTNINQTNDQTAENFGNEATATGVDATAAAVNYDGSDTGPFVNHKIENVAGTIDGLQANINNSVMISGNAQGGDFRFISAVNSANSALNNGINMLAKIDDPIQPWNYSTTNSASDLTIFQENNQTAKNHVNTANAPEGTAYAANVNKQHQEVTNETGFVLNGVQCNANNSIKLTDNAQQFAKGLMLVNAANSAVNSSINIIAISTPTNASITQVNTGGAYNWTNNATGLTAISGNINW